MLCGVRLVVVVAFCLLVCMVLGLVYEGRISSFSVEVERRELEGARLLSFHSMETHTEAGSAKGSLPVSRVSEKSEDNSGNGGPSHRSARG